MARILIIEDDPDLVTLMSNSLRRRGHDVAVAYDGSSGYFSALTENPEIILLDLLLPGFTGSELMHLLRTNPDVARIPIVVISALDAESNAPRDGRRADAYLRKPFGLERLARRIDDLLERRSVSSRLG